ncbi:DUF6929 family protein [Archangium primigenium]|uniref:DUF6929 family protein n=1 Tax=[Archangium] primigenium TaxID=2792470 RepID=UPI001EF83E2E|nr:hypothetical protein [Archangium primigenium]
MALTPLRVLLPPLLLLSCLLPACARRAPIGKGPRVDKTAAVLHLTSVRPLDLAAPERPGGPRYISAASGLVRVGDWLHVVADDSLSLSSFPVAGAGPGHLTRLLPGELPREPEALKARKPDLEALCRVDGLPGAPHGALLALPSGSTPERLRGAWVPLAEDGTIGGAPHLVDLAPLYARLTREAGPLNVEGAAWVAGHLRLLNRGNRVGGADAVMDVDGARVLQALAADTPPEPESVRSVRRWKLGRLHGVPLTFSDAAPLPDGRLVFTASAEDTRSAYTDGAVVGSAVGLLSEDGTPLWLRAVDTRVKLEGVEVRETAGRLSLWLVSDADDPAVIATLFELVLDAPADAL